MVSVGIVRAGYSLVLRAADVHLPLTDCRRHLSSRVKMCSSWHLRVFFLVQLHILAITSKSFVSVFAHLCDAGRSLLTKTKWAARLACLSSLFAFSAVTC